MDKGEFLQLVVKQIKANPTWTNEVIHATTIGLLEFAKDVNERKSNTEFMHNAVNIMLKHICKFKYVQKQLKCLRLDNFPEVKELLQSK